LTSYSTSSSLFSRKYSSNSAFFLLPREPSSPGYGLCANSRDFRVFFLALLHSSSGAYIRLHSIMFTSPLKLLQRASRVVDNIDPSLSKQAITPSQNRALVPYDDAAKEASLATKLIENRARTAAAAKKSQPKRTRQAYDPKQNE
jgi:hypothetical protein